MSPLDYNRIHPVVSSAGFLQGAQVSRVTLTFIEIKKNNKCIKAGYRIKTHLQRSVERFGDRSPTHLTCNKDRKMSLITAEWMKPIRVRRRKEFVIVGVRHSKDAGNHSRLDMHTTHAYKVHHPIQSFKDTHTTCKFFFFNSHLQ